LNSSIAFLISSLSSEGLVPSSTIVITNFSLVESSTFFNNSSRAFTKLPSPSSGVSGVILSTGNLSSSNS